MIVYEERPHWAPRLRTWADGPLEEVRSLEQLRRAAEANGGGLIAMEVRVASVLACLTTVTNLQEKYAVGTVGLIDRELEPLSSQLHEFGFDVLVYSVLDLRKVAALQRRMSVSGSAGPPIHGSVRQNIWARIPWKRYARPVAT